MCMPPRKRPSNRATNGKTDAGRFGREERTQLSGIKEGRNGGPAKEGESGVVGRKKGNKKVICLDVVRVKKTERDAKVTLTCMTE